ncbi:hypothetical protein BN946_scf185013.g151 [Trametes cinnabarina]|uniref:Xylanolytic transcriptional activator regulatory domain-containing protein n=1 Tax=Pycnoporus cinnabarinus TaxID=5643 RepID=A0A060SH36_PYCCI|nr:hypothetical protein BN946_scf185013.g151 [Trametes cinnabarina]
MLQLMHFRAPTCLPIQNVPTMKPPELSLDSPKDRFERLESRINELEALLQEKEHSSSSRSQSVSLNGFQGASAFLTDLLGNGKAHDEPFSLDEHSDVSRLRSGSSLESLAEASALGMNMSNHSLFGDPLTLSDLPPSDTGMQLISPAWPKNLPTNPFLRHLVEAFFTFTPSATRMFHVPTFLASLTLPPGHPKFPMPAILHAMCALGSMYTASVNPTPTPLDLPSYCPDGGPALLYHETGSFGDQQIKAAKEAMETAMRMTADLFAVLQAHIIVSLWYWYNARWSEACLAFATSLRYAVPCGLNVCPPFDSISSSDMTRSSIIPPAVNVIEDETRRNTFWVAYMMERHFAAVNNFAMMLDDEDIAQMLPVRGSDFENGLLVPPSERQWSFQPDVITTHLEDKTDSFVLHVKATLLLSKVKVFNGRYKVQRHLGNPAMQPNSNCTPEMPGPNWVQAVPAFVELDRLISSYRQSLPTKLRDPLYTGVLDVELFTALSTVHLVLIRFLKAAIDADSEDHIKILKTEVDFIRSVITGIGASVPHARNEVLKEIHKELNVENVEKILQETAEAREYQREINEMLAGSLTLEEEEAVQAELRELQLETLGVSEERPIQLPSAPTEVPAEPAREPETERRTQEQGRVPVAA